MHSKHLIYKEKWKLFLGNLKQKSKNQSIWEKTEPATSTKIDTDIIVLLPKNSKGFITSMLREDKINEFSNEQQQLWVEILNKSFEETLEIKKK